jgi:hypothetical protein
LSCLMFGSFLPEPWLVGTTKVYPGVGADIVMESITLKTPARLRLRARSRLRGDHLREARFWLFSGWPKIPGAALIRIRSIALQVPSEGWWPVSWV